MSDTDTPSLAGNKRNYKVGRVLEDYDLGDLESGLVAMWLGTEPGESYSLRELSDHINRQLLRTEMERAGIDPLDGEIEETYRLLRDDGVDEPIREKTVRRLKRDGIDVARIERDFVTHQSVHTYLTEFRDASKTATDPAEKLQQELTAVATDGIESLRDDVAVTLGEFEVDLELSVRCDNCGGSYSIEELVDRGGCLCE